VTFTPTVNLAGRIHPEAKFAFARLCLDLQRERLGFSDYQVAERLFLALDEKHLRLILTHALSEVSLHRSAVTVNFAARVPLAAKLAFDQFALDLRHGQKIRHDYQVLQGLCFALQLPYVQAVLLPWMRR
jgi:hypothetical protein